jgi:hypothetical protein
VRVDGRSGIAGAEEEDDIEEICEFDSEFPVDIPLEEERAEQLSSCQHLLDRKHKLLLENNKPEPVPAAPPLSHGFGGDTVAILPNARMPSASKGFDQPSSRLST